MCPRFICRQAWRQDHRSRLQEKASNAEAGIEAGVGHGCYAAVPRSAVSRETAGLPDRFALRIAEHEIVIAALDLARQDCIHSLECGLDPLDLDFVALLKHNFVTLHHLGGSDVDF